MQTEAEPEPAVDLADPDGFAAAVAPARLPMARLARRLAPHSDPDDLVQDALARAWRKRAQFDPARGAVLPWLLAIVADQARTSRRGLRRRLRVVDTAASPPDVGREDVRADVDLERAIAELAPRQQLAVHLHYFVGLDVETCAAVMTCTPGTVKSTLFDARRRLRTLLGDDDD